METDENAGAGLQGRLVIEKMVLSNFKSYACTRVVGPFHKVTALKDHLPWHLHWHNQLEGSSVQTDSCVKSCYNCWSGWGLEAALT